MMEVAYSSEILTAVYQVMGCHNPEGQHMASKARLNLAASYRASC
jgi:hypothetical protein